MDYVYRHVVHVHCYQQFIHTQGSPNLPIHTLDCEVFRGLMANLNNNNLLLIQYAYVHSTIYVYMYI